MRTYTCALYQITYAAYGALIRHFNIRLFSPCSSFCSPPRSKRAENLVPRRAGIRPGGIGERAHLATAAEKMRDANCFRLVRARAYNGPPTTGSLFLARSVSGRERWWKLIEVLLWTCVCAKAVRGKETQAPYLPPFLHLHDFHSALSLARACAHPRIWLYRSIRRAVCFYYAALLPRGVYPRFFVNATNKLVEIIARN